MPRLWLKLSLAAIGALPEGYDECGPGFDGMTLSALGLDREKTIEFVRQQQAVVHGVRGVGRCERQDRRGRRSSSTTLRFAATITATISARQMRSASKIKKDSVKDAVTLNTVEDLDEVHRRHIRA